MVWEKEKRTRLVSALSGDREADEAFARVQRKMAKAQLRDQIDAIMAKAGPAMRMVHVRCRFCGHKGSAAIPRGAKIADRLVCSSCGSRDITHQRDEKAPDLEIEAA